MSENTIDRRKVTKGLAWSVPTVVTTVAAPMAAASPTPCDNARRTQEWTRAILTTPGLGWNEGTNELTFTAEDETYVDQESVNAILTITNTDGGVTVKRAEGTKVGAYEMSSATVSTVIADLSQISAITGSVEFSKTPGDNGNGLSSYDSVMLSFDDATCSVGDGTPSPETCDTRELWKMYIHEESALGVAAIDDNGVITIEKPENWTADWEPTLVVTYYGTDDTATVTVDSQTGLVTATPPASADPFDIKRIEYTKAEFNGNVVLSRQEDAQGAPLCDVGSDLGPSPV